jgi:hypothetical protein
MVIPLNIFETSFIGDRLREVFKSVGAAMTYRAVKSGHTEKIGSFLSQKANWICSIPVAEKCKIDNSRMSRRQSKIAPPPFLYSFPVPPFCFITKPKQRISNEKPSCTPR